MRAVVLFALVIVSLTGCIQESEEVTDSDSGGPATPGPAVALQSCGSCFEPMTAWDDNGRLWVVAGNPGALAYSDDSGTTWTSVAPPPHPEGQDIRLEQDVAVWVDGTDVWWSAMMIPTVTTSIGNQVHVARTADAGLTWDRNQILHFDPVCPRGDPCQLGPTDRPWLMTFDDSASVVVSYPNPGVGMEFHGSDGEFGDPSVMADATGKFAPFGGPAVQGSIGLVPFTRAAGTGTEAGVGQLTVMRTTDAGQSWTGIPIGPSAGPDAAVGGAFTSTANDGDLFYATSLTLGGDLVLWASMDGEQWSEAHRLAPGEYVSQPWVAAADDHVAVALYVRNGTGYDLQYIQSGDGWGAWETAATVPSIQADYPHVSVRDDGELAFTWSEEDTTYVRVI